MTAVRTRAARWTASLLILVTTHRTASAGEPGSAPPSPARPAADLPTAGDKAMAEAIFRAAKELQAEGKVAEACAKYAESHRLDPKPGTILNVATCHEQEGRTATAWADYAEAATFAFRARQPEREKFAKMKIEELARKLSYVTFRFPDQPSVEVLLDAKVLSQASAGTRVPIDPGDHALEARAPGRSTWTTRVRINEGPSERTVIVPPLAADAETSARTAALPSAEPPPSDGAHRAIGWVAIGVGAAALGAGTFFGVRTLSEKSTVDEHCIGSRCDDVGLRANESAHDSATLSTIGFVVGGAAVVTGVVLLLTGGSRRAAPTTSATAASGRSGGSVLVW